MRPQAYVFLANFSEMVDLSGIFVNEITKFWTNLQ